MPQDSATALSPITKRPLRSLLWGVSIALSWTWGLGLFFSVQFSLHFGLVGLLSFAIPNMLGLVIFGMLTQRIARRLPGERDFERHFLATSHSLRFVILAYQLVAISLTFFAILAYLFAPLGLNPALGALLILAAALMLGESFDIVRIKWSHLAMFVAILLCMAGVAVSVGAYLETTELPSVLAEGHSSWKSPGFVGFLIPIVAGLLLGPWLDIQQWQRAIQIHREKASIRQSYLYGGLLFFGILLFHGFLALTLMSVGGPSHLRPAQDGFFDGKDYIVRFMLLSGEPFGMLGKVCYVGFIILCIVSTLDSGYVSLKWYLKKLTRKSEHLIMTIIPENLLSSPVVPMILALAVGMGGLLLGFRLEYFMSFYASFGVGYALVFLFRTTYFPEFTRFTQTALFSVAAFSLGLFGIGYFEQTWYLMVLGPLIPLIHGFAVISSRVVVDDLQKALPKPDSTDEVPLPSVSGKAAEVAISALENAISRLDPKAGEKLKSVIHRIEPAAAQALAGFLHSVSPGGGGATALAPIDADGEHARGHFEGKWFCHTFMTTYSDTNSVGNVYFGNYIIYVGKVREMFFRSCMPSFDLKSTGFYILTRQIEHKFNIEAKEFEILTVKIRVEGFNRKFAVLEHEIVNQAKQVLGKGKQTLMFVSAKDYRLVDLPSELQTAFLPYT